MFFSSSYFISTLITNICNNYYFAANFFTGKFHSEVFLPIISPQNFLQKIHSHPSFPNPNVFLGGAGTWRGGGSLTGRSGTADFGDLVDTLHGRRLVLHSGGNDCLNCFVQNYHCSGPRKKINNKLAARNLGVWRFSGPRRSLDPLCGYEGGGGGSFQPGQEAPPGVERYKYSDA